MSDGLFLSVAENVSKQFPDITFESELLDRLCLRIVSDPRNYSDTVMVCEFLIVGDA
jgi:isocitrate dehydrogenase (NAD+)